MRGIFLKCFVEGFLFLFFYPFYYSSLGAFTAILGKKFTRVCEKSKPHPIRGAAGPAEHQWIVAQHLARTSVTPKIVDSHFCYRWLVTTLWHFLEAGFCWASRQGS